MIFSVIGYPKTIKIMEHTKIIFCSSDNSETELEAYCNNNNEIFLSITDKSLNNDYNNQFITLNKHTAIKFVKHLKREIAILIELESEAKNG